MKILRFAGVALAYVVFALAVVLFALGRSVERTVLDASFVSAQIAKIDLAALAKTSLTDKIGGEEAKFLEKPLLATLTEQRAELQAQLRAALEQALGYLRGDRASLEVSLKLDEFGRALGRNLRAELRQNPPPQLRDAPPEERAAALAKLDAEIDQIIAEKLKELKLEDQLLTPDLRQQLQAAREKIAQFFLFQRMCLGLALAAALVLGWLGSLRTLGGAMASVGALLWLVGAAVGAAVPPLLAAPLQEAPPEVAKLVPSLVADACGVLSGFALKLFLAGCALALGTVLWSRLRARRASVAPAGAPASTPPAAAPSMPAPVESAPLVPSSDAAAVPAPASAPAAAPAAAASAPPPRSFAGQPLWRWAVGGIALLLVAGWLGDVPNRWRANEAHQTGQRAFFANDWNTALTQLAQAVRHRPTDLDYRSDFDGLQEKWLRYLQELAPSLPAHELLGKLETDHAGAVALLTEPHASRLRNLRKELTARVRADVLQEFNAISAKAHEKKFKEAYADVDRLAPRQRYVENFAELVDQVRRIELLEGIERVAAAVAKDDFRAAREALRSVEKLRRVDEDKYLAAAAQLSFQELLAQIKTSSDLGEKGDFRRAKEELTRAGQRAQQLADDPEFRRGFDPLLAAEPPEQRERLQPKGVVAWAESILRAHVAQHTARQVAAALRRNQLEAAQTALDEFANHLGTRAAATAEDLAREKNFDLFLEHLVSLGLRPAEGAPRHGRGDLVLVEALRDRLRPEAAVKSFLGQGYAEWAEELARDDETGLALYAGRLARAAGGPLRRSFESDLLNAVAARAQLAVPVVPPRDFEEEWVQPALAALTELTEKLRGGWLKLEVREPKDGELALRFQLPTQVAKSVKRDYNWNVRYQSGTSNDRNPDYDNLSYQLAQARRSYEDLRNADYQAQNQSQQAMNSGNALLALAGVATSAYSGAALEEAANRVNQLAAQLANTPAYLSRANFAEVAIPVAVESTFRRVSLELQTWDGEKAQAASRFDTALSYAVRSWPGNAAAGVPAYQMVAPTEDEALLRLRRNLGEQVKQQRGHALRPLVAVGFAEQEKSLRRATGRQRADGGWALAELSAEAGVAPEDLAERERRVRSELGLAPEVLVAAPRLAGAVTRENSLGLRLQPLPGLDGVLMSAWETRVQDFTAFVKESGYDMKKGQATYTVAANGWVTAGGNWQAPGFAQEGDHPVVGVSWQDAVAFCEWLTRKERAAGLISADQRYRLPTTTEWGVATQSVATGKSRALEYVWGGGWPAPAGAGNFASFECYDLTWPGNWEIVANYGDGAAGTAPVGQYLPTAAGLFDLAGNAAEWCQDTGPGAANQRMSYGSGWSYAGAAALKSSYFNAVDAGYRSAVSGFRVVLETKK